MAQVRAPERGLWTDSTEGRGRRVELGTQGASSEGGRSDRRSGHGHDMYHEITSVDYRLAQIPFGCVGPVSEPGAGAWGAASLPLESDMDDLAGRGRLMGACIAGDGSTMGTAIGPRPGQAAGWGTCCYQAPCRRPHRNGRTAGGSGRRAIAGEGQGD